MYAWECACHQLTLTEHLLGAQVQATGIVAQSTVSGLTGRLDAKPTSTLKRASLTLCAYFLICKQGLITVCSSMRCGEDEIS